MLKIFRSNTKFIVWITVAALALLFGAGSIVDLVNNKKSGRYAGEAFGKPVTFQEYEQFYIATRLFMPSEKPVDDPDILRQYTWQNIVYAREAKRERLNVSDQEVRGEIANILKQQGMTNPSGEQYRLWLAHVLPDHPTLSPREFEGGLREFIRIQKLLRVKIAGFAPAGAAKSADAKDKEAIAEKQKTSFLAWSNEVNKRADYKDYLALPQAQEEAPEGVEPPAPASKKAPRTTPPAVVAEKRATP